MPQAHITFPLRGHLALVDRAGLIILVEVEVVVEVQCGNQRDHTEGVETIGGKPREQIPQTHRTSPCQDHLTLVDGTRRWAILAQVLAEDQHGNQTDHTGEVVIVGTGKGRRTSILDKEGVQTLH